MISSGKAACEHSEMVYLYALEVLPADDALALEGHLAGCSSCLREFESLGTTLQAFASWPVDIVRPPASLWGRLVHRIADTEPGAQAPVAAPPRWAEPEWREVAPGISCKVLATDTERDRVSMLVRLGPGVDYPPHRHAGIEELHLLDGELLVDGRMLNPGDYIRAEAGSVDTKVWSRTGCTCVLLTSPGDELR